MSESINNGCRRDIDGKAHVYHDGYWIQCYDPPADTLGAKKSLIQALTRRLFNHMEHGINIPGIRLEEARQAYAEAIDPAEKRVKGAMLAGALFNRAADIFTQLVELESLGVTISTDNDLMRECGNCLQEALEFGKSVRHRNGDEGIDELWGEPFKAFSMPIEDFYESRYVKIAMTMRDIDSVAATLAEALAASRFFPGIDSRIQTFAAAAKRKCETLRTDPEIFSIWPTFVVACERLTDFPEPPPDNSSRADLREYAEGQQLIAEVKKLVSNITRARTPMPKSTAAFVERCRRFVQEHRPHTMACG